MSKTDVTVKDNKVTDCDDQTCGPVFVHLVFSKALNPITFLCRTQEV